MDWNAMAGVGRIARAHGIRGQVIVNLETDFPDERFKAGGHDVHRTRRRVDAADGHDGAFQNGRPVIGIEGVRR